MSVLLFWMPFMMATVLFGALFVMTPAVALIQLAKRIALEARRIADRRRLLPVFRLSAAQLESGRASARFLGVRVEGELRGFGLVVSDRPAPGKSEGLTVTLTAPWHPNAPMVLITRNAGASAAVVSSVVSPAVRTHDETFDKTFHVYGRPEDVAARLDTNVRARLLRLAYHGVVHAEANALTVVTFETLFSPAQTLDLANELRDAAEALFSNTPSAEARLLASARTEKAAAIRYQLLDVLLRHFPGTPEADEALELARVAPERGIRYLAAARAGDAGIELIEEITLAESEPDMLRVMAMRHLARHAPRERALPHIRKLIRHRPGIITRTAIELIGRLKDAESVERLILLGRVSVAEADLRTAVAEALGLIQARSAESFLFSMAEDRNLDVRLAAVAALGACGTTTAIGPLAKISGQLFTDRDIAVAARTAIARIEARHGSAEAGRLSISDIPAKGGALSLDPLPGSLSLAEGRVALDAEAHEKAK